jgi:hypothetical protein
LVEQRCVYLGLPVNLFIILDLFAVFALLLVIVLRDISFFLFLFIFFVALLVKVFTSCRLVVLEQSWIVFEQCATTKDTSASSAASFFGFFLHLFLKFLLLALSLALLPGHQSLVGDWSETLGGKLGTLLLNFLLHGKFIRIISLH